MHALISLYVTIFLPTDVSETREGVEIKMYCALNRFGLQNESCTYHFYNNTYYIG